MSVFHVIYKINLDMAKYTGNISICMANNTGVE